MKMLAFLLVAFSLHCARGTADWSQRESENGEDESSPSFVCVESNCGRDESGESLREASSVPMGSAGRVALPQGGAVEETDVSWVPSHYADLDGDGFGDAASRIDGWEVPDGYVTNDLDCYDLNQNAHPGQADFFASERGDGSFDYDCSGAEEPNVAQLACGEPGQACH